MKITELMSQPAITCSAGDDLACAAQRMWEHDCGALPVVDADGRAIGVITDRDVCMAAWTQGGTLRSIPVRVAMSKQLHACRAGDTLEAVRRTMAHKQIRRVPIVDEQNRPVGMLTMNDLARDSVRSREWRGTSEQQLAQTIAAICQPQPVAAVAAAAAGGP